MEMPIPHWAAIHNLPIAIIITIHEKDIRVYIIIMAATTPH